MKKNRIHQWFNYFKLKKEKENHSIVPPTPLIENTDLPLNKFGKPECLVDQCENKTCNCDSTECEIDNQMCYESMMLMSYIENMKKAQRAKKSTSPT